jgi:hypothetical protein
MVECDLPTLQTQRRGEAIRAVAFTGKAPPLTAAQVKRLRYLQNLKSNHQRFRDAVNAVEHFAVICELPDCKVEAIRKAKEEAIEVLTKILEEKLKRYDERISAGGET